MHLRGVARPALICTVAGLALLVGACGRLPATPAGSLPLRIEEDTVTYHGVRLTLGTRLEEWKRAFGEPSRFVDRSGGIYVWDDLGLAVSLRLPFPAGEPRVAALRIFFAPREVDFWPRTVFHGTVTFVQRSEEASGNPVEATLSVSTTSSDLAVRQHVSTRFGYPNLSRYTTVRFAARPSDDGPLELCSVQIDPHAVRLPSEAGAAGVPGTVELPASQAQER